MEGECCGSCSPPPAPPLPGPPPPPPAPPSSVEMPGFNNVQLCQDGEDICLISTDGEMEEIIGQDLSVEEFERKDNRLPIQIFPDPVEVVLGPEGSLSCLPCVPDKERLPSIVVEPTELGDVESGELRWPPEDMDFEEDQEEEDLFLEQCIPPANIADWGEEEDEEEEEEEEDEQTTVILNHQQNTSLLDLQSDAFRDDTPTLPPSSAPALN